jgi:hypothetical protein
MLRVEENSQSNSSNDSMAGDKFVLEGRRLQGSSQ